MAFTANNIEKNTGAILHNWQISQNLRDNKRRGMGEAYGGMVAHDHVNGGQAIAWRDELSEPPQVSPTRHGW